MVINGAPASQGDLIFLPFVFETYGLWGRKSPETRNAVGVNMKTRISQKRETDSHILNLELSI